MLIVLVELLVNGFSPLLGVTKYQVDSLKDMQTRTIRTISLLTVFVNGALLMAQGGPSPVKQQQTSGVVGVTAGQTARLNVLYPTAPAPILQILCSATLVIADDQGKILESKDVSQLIAGKSVSLDMNADTDLAGTPRTEVHGFSIAPNGCRLLTTLEIIDNATQKTLLVIGSEPTFPFRLTVGPPSLQPDSPAAHP